MKNLYMQQKVFSLKEQFKVFDQQQNLKYYVTGSFLRIPKQFTMRNAQEREIAKITKQIITLLPKFTVEIAGQESVVINKHLTFLKARYSINANGLEINGDWWNMNFSINKLGRKIAQVHKKWISWGDTYEIQIIDEQYEELIVAIVTAIDCVKASERAAAGSSGS